jgi:adenylate kinase
MFIALTGTPGTGKTTVGNLLETDYGYNIVRLNDIIRSEELFDGRDENRDCLLADMEKIGHHLDSRFPEEDLFILDSHLAHHFAD